MAFSIDLRARVIAAVDNGMTTVEAVKVFKICRKTICNWQKLLKTTTSLAPKCGYQKGHSHKINDWEQFKKFVEKHQQCASPQMRAEWKEFTNIDMSESAMLRALKKIGYTAKKKHLVIPRQVKKNEKNT